MKHIAILKQERSTLSTEALTVTLDALYGPELRLRLCAEVAAIPGSGEDPVDLIFAVCDQAALQNPSVIRSLGAYCPGTPVVVLVEEEDEPDDAVLKSLGADDYLPLALLCPAMVRKTMRNAERYRSMRSTLKQTRGFYFQMFSDAPSPLWIIDLETRKFVLTNKAAVQIYGYTQEEFSQMSVLDIRPKKDHERLLLTMEERPAMTVFDCGNWQHIKKNGELFWVRIFSQETTYNDRPCRMVLAVNEEERMQTAARNNVLARRLEHQSSMLDNILSSLKEVIWSYHIPARDLIYINDAAREAYGYEPTELLGQQFHQLKLIPEEDMEKIYAAIDVMYEAGSAVYEYRIRHKDGSIKYFSSHIVLKKDADDTPEYIHGIDTDITLQVLAEKQMREKSDEVLNILESITECFFALDQDWNYTYVNKEYERIQGTTREQLVGTNYWDRFPKCVDTVFYHQFSKAVRDQESVHFSAYTPYMDRWLSVNAYPNGRGLAVYSKDITQERKLREQRHKDEQNLKALINNTEDMIWSIDTDLNLISLNQTYQNVVAGATGQTPQPGDCVLQEAYGKTQLKEWTHRYQRALEGESLRLMDEVPNAGGASSFYELRINPIIDRTGAIIGASCISRDVTAVRTYLLAIEEQNARLQDIAWIHSHKIRGPVASLMGLVGLLHDGRLSEEEKMQFLDGIDAKCRELDKLIHDIDSKSAFSCRLTPGAIPSR